MGQHGGEDRIRTCGPMKVSRFRGERFRPLSHLSKDATTARLRGMSRRCQVGGIRTHDPRAPNAMRYQTAPPPEVAPTRSHGPPVRGLEERAGFEPAGPQASRFQGGRFRPLSHLSRSPDSSTRLEESGSTSLRACRVGAAGFEPATARLSDECSTGPSYTPMVDDHLQPALQITVGRVGEI